MSEFANKLTELESEQVDIRARTEELSKRINKIEIEKVT